MQVEALEQGVALKEAVVQILEELSPERAREVFEFALFLKQRSQTVGKPASDRPQPGVVFVPATSLQGLVGLVTWGGDALADTERLYE